MTQDFDLAFEVTRPWWREYLKYSAQAAVAGTTASHRHAAAIKTMRERTDLHDNEKHRWLAEAYTWTEEQRALAQMYVDGWVAGRLINNG